MEALSLIDVSAEDDFLLDLASPHPHPDPPPHAGSSVVGADASDLERRPPAGPVLDPNGAAEQVPERTESPKKRKAKAGVNLRKSLAWDSAFFTSEGVLDTEELGIVNSTFRKAQGSRLLPGIAEEMRRSGESTTSTLESESFVLQSLETELFDNVRASIQRTLGKPDKAPGMAAASSKIPKATAKAPPVVAGVAATSSKNPKATAKEPPVAVRKGVDRIPQSKIRPPVSTSNGGVGSKQRLQVASREPQPTAARVALPVAAEAKPSSRPPRALPRVSTRAPTNTATTSGIPDKRSSTGGVVNKQAVGKSANTSTSMQHRPGGVTKSSSTSKSGALSSAATFPSCSVVPTGTMPGAKTKSPTLINKNRTAQRIPIRSSSRSDISKVNPARTSRNKIPTMSHGERASPIISPSSSVDSMSSVVSGASTASTVGKMSHTSESFSTRSSSLSPSLRKSNDQPPTTKLRPPAVTEEQSSGTASGDNLKASKDTTTQGKGFKPSGLRRPTPKIGYFDAEKSIEQNFGARVQVQPTKVHFSPPATPNPRISSTQKTNPACYTFDQQEQKPTAAAPHEESSPSQTKPSSSLLLRVAQIEVEPSKVTEHEASMCKTGPVVTTDVAKESIPALHQTIQDNGDASPLTVELLNPKLSSASSTFCQQESRLTAAPHEESSTSQTKVLPSLPLGVVQMEVEPYKVTEHEACTSQAGPVVAAADTAKENIPALHHQNIQPSGDASPLKENILASHQNIQANVDASPLTLLTQKLSSISIGDASPLTMLTQKLSSISLGEATDQVP